MKGMNRKQVNKLCIAQSLSTNRDLTSFAIQKQAKNNQPKITSKVKSKSHRNEWRNFRKNPQRAIQLESHYPVMFNRVRTLNWKHSIVQKNDGSWYSIK